MTKKTTPNPVFLWFLSWIVPAYITLVLRTTAWQVIGQENLDQTIKEERFIITFWHNRILLMVPIARKFRQNVYVLSSKHRDSDFVIHALRYYGLRFIRGSTANPKKKGRSKSGSAALIGMIKALKRGNVVAVTPDGPRGPRGRCQEGIIRLAMLSGAPILPMSYAVASAKVMKSWDRFILPRPFSKGWYIFDTPLRMKKGGQHEREEYRLQLEKSLNLISAKVDTLAGHTPIEPESDTCKDNVDAKHARTNA